MLRLRVRESSGASHTLSIQHHATVAQLKASIQQATKVPTASQQLLLGFPPRPLHFQSDEQPLAACGVRNGDTLTLTSNITATAVTAPLSLPVPSPPPPPPAVLNMRVAAMLDDNSCLFHAIAYCLAGRSADTQWRSIHVGAAELRQMAAAAILSMATSHSSLLSSTHSAVLSAYLSSLPSVSSYAASMAGSDVWGGGLECAVLSEALSCRIHTVDVESGALYPFGSTGAHVCYLLFSGVHYDSLYWDAADGRVTMFSEDDKAACEAALTAAKRSRESGSYTSLSAFTLRCEECGVRVKGQQEAQEHAKRTKHTQFDEYKR